MSKSRAIGYVLTVGMLACAGCKNEECERDRVQLASKWEQIAQSAARRALGSVEGGGSPATWKQIEEQADLVRSSFETPQLTWPAAEKGKAEVEARFKALAGAEGTKAFQVSLENANQAYAAFEQKCR